MARVLVMKPAGVATSEGVRSPFAGGVTSIGEVGALVGAARKG